MGKPTIHGHTKIELKNVRTGLKEVFESDNVFQGANIAKWLHGSHDSTITLNNYDSSNFRANPWKGIVGGLLLFRDSITEGSSFMPAGNVMVGKGAIDISNTSTPSEMGSYNSVESSATGNAITQVYDFTTNQANGQISCVCLTSKEGGIIGYGNTSGELLTNSSRVQKLSRYYGDSNNAPSTGAAGMLSANGRRYHFSYNNDTLTVKKYRTCGLSTGSAFAGLYTSTTHDISTYQSIFKTSRVRVFYCGNNIFRFLPQSDWSVSSSGTIYYMEYDAATDTLEQKTLINSSAYTIYFGTSYYYDTLHGGFTRDGKLIGVTSGTSPQRTVVIDIASGVTLDSGGSLMIRPTAGLFQVSPGLYLARGEYGQDVGTGIMIDVVNNTFKPVDFTYAPFNLTNTEDSAYMQEVLVCEGTYCTRVNKNPLYLATINNLQTAITKTAAQTMKVTYTLTEV